MAARGVNKVILIGTLGQDPELKHFSSGDPHTRISLATSESWRNKQTGEMQEKTEWHNVSIIGKLAEIACEYLKKGSKVYFEGKLQTRKWQDQNGQDRYATDVVIPSIGGVMQMLDSKNQSESKVYNQPNASTNNSSQASKPIEQNASLDTSYTLDDDIPF